MVRVCPALPAGFSAGARSQQFGPDRLDLRLRARRGRRSCRGPTSRPRGAPRRWPAAPSAVRRRRAGSPALRGGRGAASRGASTTITASYCRPRVDSTSSGTSWTTIPSAGAAATWRRNSSPIAGCVIASRSCFASSSTNAISASAARSSEPSGREDLGPEALDELRERRRPRLDHLPRDQVGVDHDRAPRRSSIAATVDFPAPIPPVSPTINTAREPTRAATSLASGACVSLTATCCCSTRVRVARPRTHASGARVSAAPDACSRPSALSR